MGTNQHTQSGFKRRLSSQVVLFVSVATVILVASWTREALAQAMGTQGPKAPSAEAKTTEPKATEAKTTEVPLTESMLAPKQLMVIKPGVDLIYGTWVAAVMNKTQIPQHARVAALLPREMLDLQPMEGVTKEDMKMDASGLWIEKDFAPGVNVISFVFSAAAKFGGGTLNFKPRGDVREFMIMTPTGMLTISGQGVVSAGTDVQDSQGYTVLTLNHPVVAGEDIRLEVEGVPEGRTRLWFVGAAFGLLMLGGAGALAWRTRVKTPVVDV
jgi:hypothetical protein